MPKKTWTLTTTNEQGETVRQTLDHSEFVSTLFDLMHGVPVPAAAEPAEPALRIAA